MNQADEMEANVNEVSTLLVMLQLLGKLGVTDSMLNRKYGLNRTSLNNVRKGRKLTNSHDYYLRLLLRELEHQRQLCRCKMDDEGHRIIKETMFQVMCYEFGIRERK